MVVILEPQHDPDEWLSCGVEAASRFFTRWGGAAGLHGQPLAPRVAKPRPAPPAPPASPAAEDPGLF